MTACLRTNARQKAQTSVKRVSKSIIGDTCPKHHVHHDSWFPVVLFGGARGSGSRETLMLFGHKHLLDDIIWTTSLKSQNGLGLQPMMKTKPGMLMVTVWFQSDMLLRTS